MKAFRWLVSGEVSAVATWIGLFVSIVGLSVTFRQARTAAREARNAKTAVNALRHKLDVANAAYSSGQLSTLEFAIQRGEHALAQGLFISVKRLIRTRKLGSTRDGEYDAVGYAVRTIDNHLEHGRTGNAKYSMAKTLKALEGIAEAFAAIESEAAEETG